MADVTLRTTSSAIPPEGFGDGDQLAALVRNRMQVMLANSRRFRVVEDRTDVDIITVEITKIELDQDAVTPGSLAGDLPGVRMPDGRKAIDSKGESLWITARFGFHERGTDAPAVSLEHRNGALISTSDRLNMMETRMGSTTASPVAGVRYGGEDARLQAAVNAVTQFGTTKFLKEYDSWYLAMRAPRGGGH